MDRQALTLDKLLEYSTKSPVALTTEEHLAHARYFEEQHYRFLQRELAVRLANVIMEFQHLPWQLHAENLCVETIAQYTQSFKDVMQFEGKEERTLISYPKTPKKVLERFRGMLVTLRDRHEDSVRQMALACARVSGRHNLVMDVFLNRLYTSHISLNMITNQHLVLFSRKGEDRVLPSHLDSLVRPKCNIQSVLEDAVDKATTYVERYFMAAPKVSIESVDIQIQINAVEHTDYEGSKDLVEGNFVPNHLLIIFTEILKNAMRATVEHHFHDQQNLPDIKAVICKSNEDITVVISDLGGGMSPESVSQCFSYHTTSPSRHFDTSSLQGCGLPVARLYARFFQGDITMFSDEDRGGTDVNIHLKANDHKAREILPMYDSLATQSWEQGEEDKTKWIEMLQHKARDTFDDEDLLNSFFSSSYYLFPPKYQPIFPCFNGQKAFYPKMTFFKTPVPKRNVV